MGRRGILAKKGPLELEFEDWKRDTLALSLAAKGAWIDILGALHTAPNRGVMTLPLQGWARLIGATVDQAKAVIQELVDMRVPDHVTDGNDNVTLMSRRMIREEKERKSIRSRVENYRKRKCNATVTQMYSEGQRYIAVTKEKESSPPKEKEKISPHTPLLKEKELPSLQEKEITPPTPPNQHKGRTKGKSQKRGGVEVEGQKQEPPTTLAAWETVLKSFGDMRILPTLDAVIKRTLHFMGGHDEVRYAYKDKPEVIRGQFMQYYRGFREGA